MLLVGTVQAGYYGHKIDDDDVRHAIEVACQSDTRQHAYYCKLALAPFLLKRDYKQLLGPQTCTCDKQCPLPVALACTRKITECYDHCKDPGCKSCQSCTQNVGLHCCPCLAYGVGIIFDKHKGKRVCEHCRDIYDVHEDPSTCENGCNDCSSDCDANAEMRRLYQQGTGRRENIYKDHD